MSLLRALWGRFRCVIGDGPAGPLLIRYRLISTRWGGVYLHHLMRSDIDRDLHDRPWAFRSLILWRGYYEYEPLNGQGSAQSQRYVRLGEDRRCRWHGPLTLVRHLARDRHCLELERPAWSLIWVGARTREWGFHTEHGWVPWQEYAG